MTLLMGPVPPAYTGQSVAFSTIANYYKKDGSNIVVDISNKNSFIAALLLCIRISYYLLFYKIDTIYFTCSRSFKGSIRDIVLLFWARMRKIKVVNHLHGNDFKQFYDNSPLLYKKIVYWCYLGVDISIVLFEKMKDQFVDFPRMKTVNVANSYSYDLDICPVNKPVNKKGCTDILYLSNIMRSKGIFYLLEAIENILQIHKNIIFHIAGKPVADYLSSKQEVKKDFEDLFTILKTKYPDNIFYYGPVMGKEKINLLWKSDVFILPTFHRTEGFPISILEAMRTGNYIISTNHNYIPEIVSCRNGFLIEKKSALTIIHAIHSLLTSDKEKINIIQNHNIQYAIQNYKENIYLDHVKSIIDNQ